MTKLRSIFVIALSLGLFGVVNAQNLDMSGRSNTVNTSDFYTVGTRATLTQVTFSRRRRGGSERRAISRLCGLMRRMINAPEWFVGLRYLRAKKRTRFVSFITLISLAGIALGVAALIVILSVMNGFEGELRDRLLSMTAHGYVTGADGKLDDWPQVRVVNAQNMDRGLP